MGANPDERVILNAVSLKERVALALDFAPWERDFILDAVNRAIARTAWEFSAPMTEGLRNRVRLAGGLTEGDRRLILRTLGLVCFSDHHTYPERAQPGASAAITLAWTILDTLPPGTLTQSDRELIGGLIAGNLQSLMDEINALMSAIKITGARGREH
jgi:hypothetical protein